MDRLGYLNRRVLSALKAELLHIPRGEYQTFADRSPQTEEYEFYLPQIERCSDLKEFYFRALRWEFMYDTQRPHSTLGMTPYGKLRTQMKILKQVVLFPVIYLEKLTDLYQKLFPLPGYHVSDSDQNQGRLNVFPILLILPDFDLISLNWKK